MLKLGLYGINMERFAMVPGEALRAAITAEAAGWESVWAGEHYVLPEPPTKQSPAPGRTPMLDPFVALSAIASHTSRLLLGTGVTVVPLHQPLALAKRVASLDRLSAGRFLFGIGAGYLAPEFRALRAPMDRRGDRVIESLMAMRAIWNEDAPRFSGRFLDFDGVRAEPRPIQRPTPPLHVGGHSPASFRRAVEHGDGWYGFGVDLDGLERCIAGLRRAERAVSRPPERARLEISVTPSPAVALEPSTVRRFVELGVDRWIALPPPQAWREDDAMRRFIEATPASVAATLGTGT